MGTYKSPISGEIALTRRLLNLDECLYKLATHDRSRRYAVLTFDDGYRDNLSVSASDPRAEQRAILDVRSDWRPYTIHAVVVVGFTQTIHLERQCYNRALGRQFHCSDIRSEISAFAEVISWGSSGFPAWRNTHAGVHTEWNFSGG